MARIRTIKPDFWTDEKVVELSFPARLLFLGMLNFADDDGRLVYSTKKLKMQVFPGDEIDVAPLCIELESQSMIFSYEVSGCQYLAITNFLKHQKIDKRTPSKLPAPECDAVTATNILNKCFGYVYLVRSVASGEYKIGKASSVEHRVSTIHHTQPRGVVLIHSVESDDYSQLEAILHRAYSSNRTTGEWFSLSDRDVTFIRALPKSSIKNQRAFIESMETFNEDSASTHRVLVESSSTTRLPPPTEGKGSGREVEGSNPSGQVVAFGKTTGGAEK